MVKAQIDPGMYSSVTVNAEDFDRNGIKHKTVVFDADNDFTVEVTKDAASFLHEVLGAQPASVDDDDSDESSPNKSKKSKKE